MMNFPGNNKIDENDFLRALCDGMLEGAAIMEQTGGRMVFCNSAWLHLFELGSGCVMDEAQLMAARKHPLNRDEEAKRQTLIAEKGVYSEEVEFVTAGSRLFWGEMTTRLFRHQDMSYQLLVLDPIDRVKQAERTIDEEERRFGAFFEYASMGIVVVNNKGEITESNSFALQQFGYEKKEVLGKKIELLIPSRFHHKHERYRHGYTQQPKSRPMGLGLDLFGQKKDGTEFPVEISLGNYTTDGSKFVIAFISDISVRKQAEAEVVKLNDELEATVAQRTLELRETMRQLELSKEELSKSLEKEKELSELKSRFVSMASHEFRTPLSTVLSSAYLVEKYTQGEDQLKREKHLLRIISSVNMLTDILNDFLSVGKIEEGKIQVRVSNFDLHKSVDAIVQEMQQNTKKEQRIQYLHSGDSMVSLDPALLKHILMNLLSNAIKFSPEGAVINLTTSVAGGDIRISVKDSGIGISKEDQEHLMERFFRGSNVTNIQGTGLGLHIVAKYAELMNGKISCKSELEKGTEFSIEFKTKEA